MSTKAQLEQAIDQAVEILTPAYKPESEREKLARAIGRTLRVLKLADQGEYDEREEYYSQ